MIGNRRRGFSLIELLVAMSIAAILVVLALPNFSTFLTNTNIRSAAESVADGLRRTQVEAVRRNADVQFVLTPATGWEIHDVDDNKLDGVTLAEGSPRAKVTAVDAGGVAATRVTFSGLGRVLASNTDTGGGGSNPIATIDVTATSGADHHDLRIQVNGLGGLKMCDPALPSTDPKGCPT
jgi:type IV fimbrial biogenesis protein FimT